MPANSHTTTATVSKTQTRLRYPDRFNVIIHNDDQTPVEFVIHLLVEIFNKSLIEAKDITMIVHDQGKGIAGTYNQEIAKQKVHEATVITRYHGYPLKVTLERI
jgi:ATP-dependent Clp protease adaptor protein ClpS